MYRTGAFGLLLLIAGHGSSWAAEVGVVTFPVKPLRLVVGFAPGGGTDIVARVLAKQMTLGLGQPVIVDNRPGAGGTIANEIVLRSAADGYTVNVTTSSYAVSSVVYPISHDPVVGITPISLLATSPFLVVVNPSLPIRSVKELIAYAKAQDGRMTYASTGRGGITHIGLELFKMLAKVEMTHVPYKGTGPALTDLLRGEVQCMLGTNVTTLPHVRTGRLRALAVTTASRSSFAPDLPTVAEAGVPGYDLTIWYGVWGPPGMSPTITQHLDAEFARILAISAIRKDFLGRGLEVRHGGPAEMRDIIRRDVQRYGAVAKAANLKGQ